MSEPVPAPRPRWLLRRPDPDAPARLFCVPYSGCGASMYHVWPRWIGGIEVCPVQLPGRENRIGEQSYATFEEMAQGMLEGLRPYLDRPFGLFGHCASALACYETAIHLSTSGGPLPTCLFVSSQVAPHEGPYGRFLTLSDDELAAELVTRADMLGSELPPGFVQLGLRILRADVETHRRYKPDRIRRTGCPIVAIGWSDDVEVPAELMGGWQDYGATTYQLLPGAHYQFLQALPDLQEAIAAGFSATTEATALAGRDRDPAYAWHR